MKIVVIGATGTIGSQVLEQLRARHEVIAVASTSGAERVDIAAIDSVRALFERVGKVDAVVVAAGKVHFGPLLDISPAQFRVGLDSKLMGQVNVAQVAASWLNDGGSITLTSGIIGAVPIRSGSAAGMVNGALEGYVRGAAAELPRGLRINAVSPTVLAESLPAYGPFFGGFEAAPGSRVAQAYVRSVEGVQTGQVLTVW